MSSILLHKIKYYHLKIIHTHPKGIKNRFKDTGDKWVESLRHPHIKTYYDYFKNKQTFEHDLPEIKTQKQEADVKKILHSYKPGLAAVNDFFKLQRPVRPDDNQLSRDIKDLTFAKFIEEGRKQFTSLHKLTFYSIMFLILQVILYFTFVRGKELPKNERVKVLNAEILESYHFESQQTAIKKIIERLEIVNDQYERKLAQGKKKM